MLHRTIQGNEGNISTETDMAKTGRPPLEPRIAALEARMAEIEKALATPVAQLTSSPSPFIEGPNIHQVYKPLFDRWPGNGS